jgi:1-acyl-sn-glycerol-3-phosphate acyltransferase
VSELFYKAVRAIGAPIFLIASRPLILHRERAELDGAYLLAANHESAFDAALLIATTPRVIYWLSIVEIFQHPLSRWFLTGMGASPLDRSKADATTVRTITRHLRAGRAVGIFPEGGLRDRSSSVLAGGAMKDGVARLAQIAGVPVVPCVIEGGGKFARWQNWLPLRRTRWAVAFGEPIYLRKEMSREAARAALRDELQTSLVALHEEVRRYV